MSASAMTAEEIANAGGRDYEFWRAHGGVGLVWSNCNASDDVMICHALLRPSFHLLLEIAARFGLTRLERLWLSLQEEIVEKQLPEEIAELVRARPTVERCLRNMREGLAAR
jgi:hypothetical protein